MAAVAGRRDGRRGGLEKGREEIRMRRGRGSFGDGWFFDEWEGESGGIWYIGDPSLLTFLYGLYSSLIGQGICEYL